MPRRVIAGFGLLLLVLITNAALAAWNVSILRGLDLDQARAQMAMTELEGLLATIKDAETSQRGFLLTADASHLVPYRRALQNGRDGLRPRLARLRQEAADDETQRGRLDELQRAVERKLEEFNAVARAAEAGGPAAAVAVVKRHGPRQAMDDIRAAGAAVRAWELERLEGFRKGSDDCSRNVLLTILLGALFSLGLAGLALALDYRDRVARARAADLIRSQREWFEVALLGIADGVIATDADGRVTLLNPVAQALTGFSSDEAAGRPIGEVYRLVRERTRVPAQTPVERALRDGTAVGPSNHKQLIARDGGERPVEDTGSPIRDASGRLLGAVLVFRDVTERLRHERKLRQLAAASLAIHSSSSLESVLRVIAEEARRLIGAHLAVGSLIVGDDWTQGLHAVSLSERYAAYRGRHIRHEGTGIVGVLRRGNAVVRLSQAELEAHPEHRPAAEAAGLPPLRGWLAAPFLSHGGRNLGMIQLSDREQGEFSEEDESLLTQLARIASVAIENARLTERLREADRQKDDFMAMLAHELRNPLAPVRNAAQILRLRGDDPRTVEWAGELMERQTQHMTRMVDDLLDASRIARGKVELQRRRLNLADLVRTTAEDHRAGLSRAGLELAIEAPDGPVIVDGDATRLAQVLGNLLHNAGKFTEAGGRIEVRLAAGDRRARVSVRDSGVGIEPRLLPHVFDSFTQADRTLERTKGGLGLGLALVKGLVELHQGDVAVDSEGLGRGAEFSFSLPLAAAAEPARGPEEAAPAARRLRVLLIEDNVDAALSLKMLLELYGHEVSMAHAGTEGVEAARRLRPELILCDLGLPGMSGFEVARTLRQEAALAATRLVAVSGYGQEEDQRQAREAGFDRALVKPVSPEALRRLLAELT